jgi:hypothetical protein
MTLEQRVGVFQILGSKCRYSSGQRLHQRRRRLAISAGTAVLRGGEAGHPGQHRFGRRIASSSW